MKYLIASARVGIVGEEYEPTPGVNIEALIAGGFITTEKESTETPKKSPTIKKTPKE
jgi:hypothetical protein